MTLSLSRRQVLAGTLLMVPASASFKASAIAQSNGNAGARLAKLEARGGRLGVAIHNLATGAVAGNRADERFLMASTFKTLLAACILARVDRGEEQLDRRVTFSRSDLVPWSPVTEVNVDAGMTIGDLCSATVTTSDNTAANLLLASFGGPQALTAFAREIGDEVTRFDRTEPTLNEHDGPGDIRDTTTPAATLENLRTLFLGDALSPQGRSQLTAWHVANTTGDARLRAGFPRTWRTADKTGTNRSGTSNDIGITWPPDRAPILVTVYCEMPGISGKERDAVIAEVGRIAAET